MTIVVSHIQKVNCESHIYIDNFEGNATYSTYAYCALTRYSPLSGSGPVPGDTGVLRPERLHRHGRYARPELNDPHEISQSRTSSREQNAVSTATGPAGSTTGEPVLTTDPDVTQQRHTR